MPDYNWPEPSKRTLMGKRISRLDGPDKVSGKAKYTLRYQAAGNALRQDRTLPVRARKDREHRYLRGGKNAGGRSVKVIQGPGTEIQWAGDEIVAVAASEECIAEDAARAVKVVYEKLPHLVREEDLSKAGDRLKPAAEKVTREIR